MDATHVKAGGVLRPMLAAGAIPVITGFIGAVPRPYVIDV